MNIIGTDCIDIILNYKKDLESYETMLYNIKECAETNGYNFYCILPILLKDFKNFIENKKIRNKIKFQMKIYGNNRDNYYFDLNFNDINEKMLNSIDIYRMWNINGRLYLKLYYNDIKEKSIKLESLEDYNGIWNELI